jgi:carboxylesterase
MMMPGAEPFFRRGGAGGPGRVGVGALLVHGFTGVPREVRPLGEALAAAGHTVLGVRLAQHGTQPSDMIRSHWHDWYGSVLDGYTLLRDQCEKVFVMGLSMGGALALYLAAHQPVAGVVTMATPSRPFLASLPWRSRYALPLSYVRPYVRKGPPSPTSDPGHIAYDRYPVRAIAQLLALVAQVAVSLPRVTAPALIIHSRADGFVPDANAEYIYDHLGSAQKDLVWLSRSGHILPEEVERAVVFESALAFVQAHTPAPLFARP